MDRDGGPKALGCSRCIRSAWYRPVHVYTRRMGLVQSHGQGNLWTKYLSNLQNPWLTRKTFQHANLLPED